MTLKLVTATHDDLKKIHDIQKSAFEKLYIKYEDETTSPFKESFDSLEEKFTLSGNHFFLISDENKSVGFLKITVNKEITIMRISPIAILPQFENMGYGKRAMVLAERLFPVEKVILSTITQETKLMDFYQSLGYNSTGSKKSLIPNMDFTFFEKYLKNTTQ